MPGEQLIQTRADPRLKSSPDRSRRCSFIFLGRFADGWKNQCPTEESGGGGAREREGKKRERGSGREAKGEGSVPGEAGGPHGVVGWRVGWWHLQPPPALVVWGSPCCKRIKAEQGYCCLHAVVLGHYHPKPPRTGASPRPAPLLQPRWKPQIHTLGSPRRATAAVHGNTSPFQTSLVPTARSGGRSPQGPQGFSPLARFS